jgi:hypothetical protein
VPLDATPLVTDSRAYAWDPRTPARRSVACPIAVDWLVLNQETLTPSHHMKSVCPCWCFCIQACYTRLVFLRRADALVPRAASFRPVLRTSWMLKRSKQAAPPVQIRHAVALPEQIRCYQLRTSSGASTPPPTPRSCAAHHSRPSPCPLCSRGPGELRMGRVH